MEVWDIRREWKWGNCRTEREGLNPFPLCYADWISKALQQIFSSSVLSIYFFTKASIKIWLIPEYTYSRTGLRYKSIILVEPECSLEANPVLHNIPLSCRSIPQSILLAISFQSTLKNLNAENLFRNVLRRQSFKNRKGRESGSLSFFLFNSFFLYGNRVKNCIKMLLSSSFALISNRHVQCIICSEKAESKFISHFRRVESFTENHQDHSSIPVSLSIVCFMNFMTFQGSLFMESVRNAFIDVYWM